MIVLDEQLLNYGLRATIARWYRGRIVTITELRPGSVIRDDAIPAILREGSQPTFVTINVEDFWRRLAPDTHFFVACFALSHSQAGNVATLLRQLFHLPPFRTRRLRSGKIARVSTEQVQFYTVNSWAVQTIRW